MIWQNSSFCVKKFFIVVILISRASNRLHISGNIYGDMTEIATSLVPLDNPAGRTNDRTQKIKVTNVYYWMELDKRKSSTMVVKQKRKW